MAEEASFQRHLRVLDARHKDLRTSLHNLIHAFSKGDRGTQAPIAQLALSAAASLRDALAPQDQPAWLAPIEDSLRTFCQNQGARFAADLNKTIAVHWAAMDKEQWAVESDDIAFDFDRVFSKHYKASTIPALFDKLVDLLTRLIEARDQDGRYVVRDRGAIEAIEKLIATLRKNRNASLYSTICTYQFVTTFAKRFAWKESQRYEIVKDLIESFKETVAELTGEMQTVQNSTLQELQSTISVDFYALQIDQDFPGQGDDLKRIAKDEE